MTMPRVGTSSALSSSAASVSRAPTASVARPPGSSSTRRRRSLMRVRTRLRNPLRRSPMPPPMPKPPTSDPRKFGIDQSRYQADTNYATMKLADDPPEVPQIEFCGVCSGISYGFQDKWFPHHWKGLKDIAIKRMPYHILYPGEAVEAQIGNMLRVIGNDPGEGPAVIDIELDHGQTKSKITQAAEQAVIITKRETGRQPLIYTRPIWVRDFMLKDIDWYEEVLGWMAVGRDDGMESAEAQLTGLMTGA